MEKIKLTDEQKNVIKVFMRFLMNTKERFMIIQGAAGTGKTTMIREMLKSIDKQYKLLKTLLCENADDEGFEILLTATTNKAAAVLRDLADSPYVRTVHSTLGLTMNRCYSTGEEFLVKTKNFQTLQNTILIIDEGSMTDMETFNFLNEALGKTSKAVIIGDIYQLPPVNQKISTMQTMLHKVPTATLNTVMRHGGPILEAASAFRNVVQTNVFEDILLHDKKVIHIDGPAFKDEVEAAFLDPGYEPHKAKILAWSNDRVQEYNDHLRIMKGLGSQFQVGERVVTNNRILGQGIVIPVDTEVEITWLGREVDLHGVPGRRVEINGHINAFLPNKYQDARSLMKQLRKEAIKAGKEDRKALRKSLWSAFYEVKDSWLDLRSSFASTVHKSQGSSYDEVFIDLDDIGRCNVPSDVARLLYVAISRARKRVILSGTLPVKYRSQLAA